MKEPEIDPSPYRILYEKSQLAALDYTQDGATDVLTATQAELIRHGIRLRHAPAGPAALRQVIETARQLREVFLVTNDGMLKDRNDEPVSVYSQAQLNQILSGERQIQKTSSTDAVLAAANVLLPHVGRVVITSNIIREIDDWRGSGTLLIDESQITSGKAEAKEQAIFSQLVAPDLVGQGYFKPRDDREMEQLLRHHYALRLKGILGGLSLVPEEGDDYQLAGVWTPHPGNGLGARLMEMGLGIFAKIKKAKRLYALTSNAAMAALFQRFKFVHTGNVQTLRSDPASPLAVQKYPVGRSTEMYVYHP